MEKQYDSFIFYDSFYNAISLLPLESQARVYNAIFKFALANEETELQGAELAIYLLIKPQLLANREKRENGSKGGAPKCNQNAKKKTNSDDFENNQKQPTDNFSTEENNQKQPMVENFAKKNNQKQPNVNVNVNDNVNVKERNKQREKVQNDKLIAREALSLYNSLCGNLVKCTELTDKRQKIIENCTYSVDRLKEIFMRANESCFLQGNNPRGFRANFDWLMNKDNAVKVLEGMYDNVVSKNATNGQIISDRHNYSQKELDNLFCKVDESNFDL